MTRIQRSGADFVVDAGLLAEAFSLPPADVPALMKEGRITSRFETGIEDDAGSYRLTFWHGGLACRFTVDENGVVLKRATFDAARRPGPQPAGGA